MTWSFYKLKSRKKCHFEKSVIRPIEVDSNKMFKEQEGVFFERKESSIKI